MFNFVYKYIANPTFQMMIWGRGEYSPHIDVNTVPNTYTALQYKV